jgi:hypothetical protein
MIPSTKLTQANHGQAYVVIASKSGLVKGMKDIKNMFLQHTYRPLLVWLYLVMSLDTFGFGIENNGVFGQVL